MQTSSSSMTSIGATTLLAPLPTALLTCMGTEPGFDRLNLITVAWTGIVCSKPPMLSVSIKPSRFSYQQILQQKAFCLNLIDHNLLQAADFCGVRSGRDVDKFAHCHLSPLFLPDFPVPSIQGAPVSICCTVSQIIPLGSHDLFLCNIQDVHVRNDLIDVTGAVHLENACLIGYEHGQYFSLSSKACGFFGYSVASQQALLRRKRHANTRVKESNHHDPQSKTSGDCAKRYPKNSL